MNFIYLFSISWVLISICKAQCVQTFYTGEGTYYGYSGGGNCSFPTPYTDLYSAAVNASQYTDAVLCGACAEVTGYNGTITVSLEDQCPECKPGDLDLEQEAFPFIDDPIKGRVPIRWKIVPCPVSGPVSFYFKEGSSRFWASVQIRNHVNPVAKVELLFNGSYQELPRESYNYFLKTDGMGEGPFTFRITDQNGNSIVEENIPFMVTTTIEGKNQFPVCNPMAVNIVPDDLKDVLFISDQITGTTIIRNKSKDKVSFKLINTLGEVIDEDMIHPLNEKNIKTDNTGIYFVSIQKDKKIHTQKIILY